MWPRFVAVAVVCAPHIAEADRAVTGTVLDAKSGKPVPGALVAIGSADTGTDDDGHFRLADVPFGRLDVVVIADGYRAYFGSARVGADLVIRPTPDEGAAGEVIEISARAPEAPPVPLDTEEIRTLPGAGNDAL